MTPGGGSCPSPRSDPSAEGLRRRRPRSNLGDPDLSRITEQAVLPTALSPEGGWIPHVLAAAAHRLDDLRSGQMPDAGALVLASNQENARVRRRAAAPDWHQTGARALRRAGLLQTDRVLHRRSRPRGSWSRWDRSLRVLKAKGSRRRTGRLRSDRFSAPGYGNETGRDGHGLLSEAESVCGRDPQRCLGYG